MLSGFDSSLEERLKQAEQAENELTRLQPVAAEAPKLRLEKAKVQKRQEQERAKESSMRIVHHAVEAATAKQARVPQILETAGRAMQELYALLREIDGHRRDATESLAIVDRIDYDIEVEEGEEQEIARDRDPRGLAYALAARHGEVRVRSLLQDLDPDFGYLRSCNLSEPLVRDMAKFIMEHAVSSQDREMLTVEQT